MIHVHQLDGCAPAPLAHYLKALGILRLVSEQADRDTRGWWQGAHFMLATKLTEEELEAFFLHDYQPTPIFNPWGARSGFYPGGSETSARESLKQIECSSSSRLELFRKAISVVRSVIEDMTAGHKPSDKDKDGFVLKLRSNVRGASSLWLDSVTAVIGVGNDMSLELPPIFGTGGNEGSGGYPSAYMSAIVDTIVNSNWNHAVHTALFGECTSRCLWDKSMGQFAPGTVSTPWDMLLAFEGACVLKSSVSVRTTTTSQKWMSSPFYVAPRAAGYASGSRVDEKYLSKGKEYPGRGEQWLPIWERPLQVSELHQLFSQGRAATKAGHATDSWSMARAVSTFGVSRGIAEFLRFGYQQRNNQATHFAIPLGRFRTIDAGPTTSSCLDDLDRWLHSLHRVAHPTSDQEANRVPARVTNAYRRLMDALFSVVDRQAMPQEWQYILLGLGSVEAVMRQGSDFAAGPVPRLRPEWVAACNDGAPEFRLALAFALQTPIDPIRRHWLPLDRKQPWRFATTGTGSASRLDVQPDVVMHGRRGLLDAVALVERRLVESSQAERRYPALTAAPRAAANVADLTALLGGDVDLDRIVTLGRALMALDQTAWARQQIAIEQPHTQDWPDDAWLAIRLCTLPWAVKTPSGFELDIGTEPALIRRLVAGDAGFAVDIALRRLRAAGVRCTIRASATDPGTARLWAASLAFPITRGTAKRFLYRLDPSKELT